MLVVTANWAITDGTLVMSPRQRQTEWLAAVHRAAIRAGARRDGRYAAIERLEVVLAGDTLDPLVSSAWQGGVRPWHEGRRAADLAAAVMVRAASHGRRLFGGLRHWVRHGLPLPAADRRGRPEAGRTCRIPVCVTVLPGDRDRWLAAVGRRLALRGIRVAPALTVGGVAIAHGAELDPFCQAGESLEPGRPTLGESLAVDLVARFGTAVRERCDLWPACRGLVARLAAARHCDLPQIVARWIVAPPLGGVSLAVRDAWRAAVDGWRREARLAEPACGAGFDSVDAVAAWMDRVDARPRQAAPEIESLFAVTAPPPSSGGTSVLGHLPGCGADRSVVCLGQASTADAASQRPSGVEVACVPLDAGAAGSGHVVFVDSGRPDAWEWLMTDAAGCRPSTPARGDALRIVDAA